MDKTTAAVSGNHGTCLCWELGHPWVCLQLFFLRKLMFGMLVHDQIVWEMTTCVAFWTSPLLSHRHLKIATSHVNCFLLKISCVFWLECSCNSSHVVLSQQCHQIGSKTEVGRAFQATWHIMVRCWVDRGPAHPWVDRFICIFVRHCEEPSCAVGSVVPPLI